MTNRRKFLNHAIVALAGAPFVGCGDEPLAPSIQLDKHWYDDTHKATLPAGATLRIVARSGQKPLQNSEYRWHSAPDGGACFKTQDAGWVYVSNSEMPNQSGGVGALRFDKNATVTNSYSILQNTSRNCAGGKSLWGTWLSCEENDELGQVYECDPLGIKPARVLPALGRFNHEAVAMDPNTGIAYLTEDKPDGCLYRFTPKRKGDLSEGILEVATIKDKSNQLSWQTVPNPTDTQLPVRYQVKNAARFNGGEGIIYFKNKVFFSTKYDNRIWTLDIKAQQVAIIYDAADYSRPILTGVDNIEICPNGDLLVAEDGGDMQIVALTPQGKPTPLITLHNQEASEITGPAFSPQGNRLYFSSQRGFSGLSEHGITYELTLPWATRFS